MSDTETEAETLERLEAALRRIGELARLPKAVSTGAPSGGAAAGEGAAGPEIDREALLHSLDLLITRLRNGLELPKPSPVE